MPYKGAIAALAAYCAGWGSSNIWRNMASPIAPLTLLVYSGSPYFVNAAGVTPKILATLLLVMPESLRMKIRFLPFSLIRPPGVFATAKMESRILALSSNSLIFF